MELRLSQMLRQLYQLQQELLRQRLPEWGLSSGQPKILRMLQGHDGCMQKELATLCGIEPATVSRLLDPMEQGGLIVRKSDRGDKRALQVWLTPKGQELQARVRDWFVQTDELALAGFSPQERETLQQDLERIYKNLSGSNEK